MGLALPLLSSPLLFSSLLFASLLFSSPLFSALALSCGIISSLLILPCLGFVFTTKEKNELAGQKANHNIESTTNITKSFTLSGFCLLRQKRTVSWQSRRQITTQNEQQI